MEPRVRIGLTGISFKPFRAFTEDQYRKRKAEMKAVAAKLGGSLTAAPGTFKDSARAGGAART